MAELDYLVLADGVAQRPDGKLDLYGAGFDTIYAPNVPARHGPLAREGVQGYSNKDFKRLMARMTTNNPSRPPRAVEDQVLAREIE